MIGIEKALRTARTILRAHAWMYVVTFRVSGSMKRMGFFFSFAYSMAADSVLPSCSVSFQIARIMSDGSMICRYAVGKASSDSVWQAVTMQEHCSSTEKYRSLRYGGHLVAHSSCGVRKTA